MTANFEKLERFSVDIADHIAVVTMTHPPVNAQDRLFRLEFVRILDVLGAEPSVRVIVLTGSGKLFSAGADLREREKILDEPGGYAHHNRLVRSAFDVIIECPKPIIAAMNGGAPNERFTSPGGKWTSLAPSSMTARRRKSQRNWGFLRTRCTPTWNGSTASSGSAVARS